VFLFSLELVLGLVVPAYVVRRDVRTLDPKLLARAWPDTSIWVAVALVSVLAVPLHFIRTRRTLTGVLLGLLWLLGCLAVLIAASAICDLALP
jgi:CHASE2 domain-containing sensor protein